MNKTTAPSLADLRALETKTAEMRSAFETARTERLTNLHTELDFESTDALISALKSIAKPAKKRVSKKDARKERVSLTPENKASLVADLTAGKYTNDELAAKYGISSATVQNVKKAAGLVKPTAASTPEASAPATPAAAAA